MPQTGKEETESGAFRDAGSFSNGCSDCLHGQKDQTHRSTAIRCKGIRSYHAIRCYNAFVRLGKEVDATYPTAHITRALIDEVIPTFQGEQWQTPPAFSAIQINGKRAYEFARKGEEVELKPRLLVIDEIEVLEFDQQSMQLTIRVVCSKGTYIRALARDIGERLKSGAHLIALRRTRVGNTRVEDCLTIEKFLEQLNNCELKSLSEIR